MVQIIIDYDKYKELIRKNKLLQKQNDQLKKELEEIKKLVLYMAKSWKTYPIFSKIFGHLSRFSHFLKIQKARIGTISWVLEVTLTLIGNYPNTSLEVTLILVWKFL